MVTRSLKFIAVFTSLTAFGLIFGWAIFPAILKSRLRKEMALTNHTEIRMMWQKLPFAMDYKVYLFNYTNPEEVQKGGIPIVHEVGPYHFDEWCEKVEVEENDNDDTLSYKRLDTFYFRPDLSGTGLTGHEIITMPNIFLLGTVATVFRDTPAVISVVGKGLNVILENPQDVFMRVKVLDITFRGIKINCDRKQFAAKALCSGLKQDLPPGFILEPQNQLRFSLFGVKNHTVDSKIITVNRGKNNVLKVGSIMAINGNPEQKSWRDECNKFVGTDATVFPPFMKKTDRVPTFIIDLCRPFRPTFLKKTNYQGIKTYRYATSMGDFANDPELQCFCASPDNCLPKGLMDMNTCIGAPLYTSMPHFFDGDPKIQQRIIGLTPDFNKHAIIVDFEPLSGTPMLVKKRVQFNIQLVKAEKFNLTKDLSGDIIPLFWVEEGLALNKTYVRQIKRELFLPKRSVNVLRWSLVSLGIIGILTVLAYHLKDRIINVSQSREKISKITPKAGDDEEGMNISVIGEPQNPAKIDM